MNTDPRATVPREYVSGLDDLAYDITLTDARTGAPITTGAVSVRLVRPRTTTPLHPTAGVCALTPAGGGRWTGDHDAADVAAALNAGPVPIGGEFDRLVVVDGLTGGRLVAVGVRVSVA